MSRRTWWRVACLCLLLAMTGAFGVYRFAGIENPALAGPVEKAGLSLENRVDNPILLVTDKIHKPKSGCLLCNDKGYCLDTNDKEACQGQKNVIETTWGPGYKWKCRCSKKATPASHESACCWPVDIPAAKSCGEAKAARNAAVINHPGKAIECGPYE